MLPEKKTPFCYLAAWTFRKYNLLCTLRIMLMALDETSYGTLLIHVLSVHSPPGKTVNCE